MSECVLPMSSFRSFIVSGLTLRSLINLEFIFAYGVGKCSSFILLQLVDQFPQHHLLKKLSFSIEYSCLENPRDGGAWWAAVYGVAQSGTQLKQLSSSRSSRAGMSCLYIFEINSLSVALIAIIFSHSEDCLFTLFIVSFVVQKLLSLIRSHLFIFSFYFQY